MSNDFRVRWATLEDRDFLTTTGVTRLPEVVLQRKLASQEVIVACRKQTCLGYLLVDHLCSYVPFVATAWVVESERRLGVGRAMLSFLEEDARAKGNEVIYSSSQCDEVEPQAWHRRVGFEECGILSSHNEGVGEVFFRKRLL